MKTQQSLKTSRVHTKLKSHSLLMREKYASNQAIIQSAIGLKEKEYQHQVFEVGCQFLELIYDRSNPEMNAWYERLAKDPKNHFWMWFNAEFKILENSFLSVVDAGIIQLTAEEWDFFITGLPHDETLEQSLFQFLKFNPYARV